MMDEFTVSWLSHWIVLSLAWLAGDEASMEELGFAGEAQRRAGPWQRGSSGIGQDQEENKSRPEPGSRQPTPRATCSEACTNMYVCPYFVHTMAENVSETGLVDVPRARPWSCQGTQFIHLRRQGRVGVV